MDGLGPRFSVGRREGRQGAAPRVSFTASSTVGVSMGARRNTVGQRAGLPGAAAGTSLLLLLALTGCATDRDPASSIDCNTPGYSADEIKIGLIYPDTGPVASSFVTARGGIDARLGRVNAEGGIHGRQVVYEWQDDQADPVVNAQAARFLVEQEDAFALLQATTAASGGAPYLTAASVPVVGLPTDEVWSTEPNMFGYTYIVNTGGSVSTFGVYARQQGGTKAVILDSGLAAISSNIGNDLAASFESQGIPYQKLEYSPTATSVQRIGQDIRNSGADVIAGAVDAADFADVLVAARAAGADIKVALATSGYRQELVTEYGRSIAGMAVYLVTVPFEADTEAHRRYLDDMALYAPGVFEPKQEVPFASYVTADLLVRGLEEAGPCPTREGYIEALRGIEDFDAGGLLPGPTDVGRSHGQISTCYTFVRVNDEGSAFEIAPGAAELCGERLDP
nr:ABC transporter substrate-binding protein [Micromonospora sp. DSM 115978]